ncbi:hypothetical protein [Streptomyces sp. RFCAC02]|uniref:hypothetical protein n=1 Tax=Streptomyces sp. RFCAC02 TaxID=2499143 RepID=UPI00101EC8F7|nr:hypothetical protein [Streptomyces sp. RFCAC02]
MPEDVTQQVLADDGQQVLRPGSGSRGVNIEVIASEVEDAAQVMRNSATDVLSPCVDTCNMKVQGTLGTDLQLPETEAVLRDTFTKFSASLTELVDAVHDYANQFVMIKDNLLQLDHEYAQAMLNPGQ